MQYQQYEDSQRELRQQGHYRQASHEQVIYFGQLDQVGLAAHQHAAQQMLRKAAIIMGRSQETLENASRELRRRSALAAMGHAPRASSEHTPQYGGVHQDLGAKQTSQWLEARMKTCTLSKSQTARAVAKSSPTPGLARCPAGLLVQHPPGSRNFAGTSTHCPIDFWSFAGMAHTTHCPIDCLGFC